jgi:hypothetical protein
VSVFDDQPDVRIALDALAAGDALDPEVRLCRREVARLVQLTLDHLPNRYGDVLEWKYIQDLSVSEIRDPLSDRTSLGATFRAGSNFPIPAYLEQRAGGLYVGGLRNQVRLP